MSFDVGPRFMVALVGCYCDVPPEDAERLVSCFLGFDPDPAPELRRIQMREAYANPRLAIGAGRLLALLALEHPSPPRAPLPWEGGPPPHTRDA